jgi:delta-1-pyrroline-5-carboxylate synthetase
LIDLVIPRGSNALVTDIRTHSRIPVLGHSDGVCHIYIDQCADLEKAKRLLIDAKTDYPAACNSAETLLLHNALVESGQADVLLRSVRSRGVVLFGGSRALQLGLTDQALRSFHEEYGDLRMSVEVVDSVDEAVVHINRHGSAHTDCIVTEDTETAELFLRTVDSACVFHNASTRFADGFRFGLGAEVGISTGRLHARGPVGVDGLLTNKWLLRSKGECGHIVDSQNPATFTHKRLLG